jgi:hypothetical protein
VGSVEEHEDELIAFVGVVDDAEGVRPSSTQSCSLWMRMSGEESGEVAKLT